MELNHLFFKLEPREVFSVLSLPRPDFYKCVDQSSLYNLLLMRNTFFLLTVGLLLWSTCSDPVPMGITIGVVGPLTSPALQCLKTALAPNYLERVIVRIYRTTNIHSVIQLPPNGANTIINSVKQDIRTNAYAEFCARGNLYVAARIIYGQMPIAVQRYLDSNQAQYLSKSIIVKVIPTKQSECQWNFADPKQQCQLLGRYISQLNKYNIHLNGGGYSPIIFTNKKDWTKFFQGECNNFANDYGVPLIYANYGTNGKLASTPNFDDFEPFGGWTYAVGKKILHNVEVPLNCGPTPQTLTVEQYIFPL